jgi:hypothetical protein
MISSSQTVFRPGTPDKAATPSTHAPAVYQWEGRLVNQTVGSQHKADAFLREMP